MSRAHGSRKATAAASAEIPDVFQGWVGGKVWGMGEGRRANQGGWEGGAEESCVGEGVAQKREKKGRKISLRALKILRPRRINFQCAP